MFKLRLEKKNKSKKENGKEGSIAGHFFRQAGFLFVKKGVVSGFQAGFTLIEMVIVIAMIGIITGATLKLVRFSDIYKNLTLKTMEIKGILRNAQILSLAPPVIEKDGNKLLICGFGLRNDSSDLSKVSLFYSYSPNNEVEDCANIGNIGDVCDEVGAGNACLDYETKKFDGFTITRDGNSQPVKIFFRSPYGETVGVADTGYNIVIKQAENNYTKTIKVNKFGKINEE